MNIVVRFLRIVRKPFLEPGPYHGIKRFEAPRASIADAHFEFPCDMTHVVSPVGAQGTLYRHRRLDHLGGVRKTGKFQRLFDVQMTIGGPQVAQLNVQTSSPIFTRFVQALCACASRHARMSSILATVAS